MSYLVNYQKWRSVFEAETPAPKKPMTLAQKLENLTPGVGAFLKTALASQDESLKSMVMNLGTQVVEYVYDSTGGNSGTLTSYKIYNNYAIPVPVIEYSFINNAGSNWATKKTVDDVVKTSDVGAALKLAMEEAGPDLGTKLANIWKADAGWLANITNKTEALNKAVAAVTANADLYKQSFLKFTRSASGIEQFWKSNHNAVNRSQFYLSFLSKVPVKTTAYQVYDIIKDVELENAIAFKAKNFKDNGQYPDIKIPAPIV